MKLYIQPTTEKGRAFQAELLAHVTANVWPGHDESKAIRPIYATLAGTPDETRAFIANLRCGSHAKPAERGGYRKGGDAYEFQKSAGYQWDWQRETEGCIVTAHIPEVFRLDPGMVDPSGIRFVCLPSTKWIDAQHVSDSVDAMRTHLAALGYAQEKIDRTCGPVTFLWAAYLDRRTRAPLITDPRFYAQLLATCLDVGAASFSGDGGSSWRDPPWGTGRFSFQEHDTKRVGLAPGIAMKVKHEEFEKVLGEQVKLFYKS